jgi:hypothetical protein
MPVSWIYSSINAGQESEVILILALNKAIIVGNRENNTITDVQAGGVWFKATAGEIFAARKQHFASFCFRHFADIQMDWLE